MLGFFNINKRLEVFSKEHMTKFKAEHTKAFGADSSVTNLVGGWPDSGDGRYSQKLSYEDWMEFNKAQRAH